MQVAEQRPRHILIEGGDGAGKTSVINGVRGRLAALGIKSVVHHDSSYTAPIVGEINDLAFKRQLPPLTQLFLINASRTIVSQNVRISLAEGDWVISDRTWISTVVYQGIAGGLGVELAEEVSKIALGGTYEPDLAVLLDMPDSGEGFRRLRTGGAEDDFEAKELEFHELVYKSYRQMGERYGLTLIDASRRPGEVLEELWALVESLIEA